MTRRWLAALAALAALGMPAPVVAAAPITGADGSMDVVVGGHGDIPSTGVAAAVLNVTSTDASGPSYVTVFPAGSSAPKTSNLNIDADRTVANLVVTPLGTDGRVTLLNHSGSANVIVDAVGWFPTGAELRPITPVRALDTRSSGGVLRADATTTVAVAGRGEIPTSGVGSVVVNLTATDTTDATFVTAWPTGQDRPLASNLNPAPGRTTANLAVVALGTDGSISLYNHAGLTHMVVDIVGWFPTGSAFHPTAPTRFLDTRPSRLGPGEVVDVPVLARSPIARSGVQSVVVNITATNATAETFLVGGQRGSVPATSSLNVRPGETVSNLAVISIGAGFSIFNHAGEVAVVVDVLGWFDTATSYHPIEPSRLIDTRRGEVAHTFPIPPGVNASYARSHHDYPASDIIAACGTPILAPVTGTVVHVRRVDAYVATVGNPATLGGRSLAIVGDDGVRYYGSHFESISVEVGQRVTAGDQIGLMGATGDAGVCHLHFGISPACGGQEWSVRRGVIWPWPYLDSWRAGGSASPVAEIAAWSAAHPAACAAAQADPHASEAG